MHAKQHGSYACSCLSALESSPPTSISPKRVKNVKCVGFSVSSAFGLYCAKSTNLSSFLDLPPAPPFWHFWHSSPLGCSPSCPRRPSDSAKPRIRLNCGRNRQTPRRSNEAAGELTGQLMARITRHTPHLYITTTTPNLGFYEVGTRNAQ
ncbi:hypothetical protein V496_08669 [Pseudogymnoascus sp. VKM F-4515 (FW-2607)]|nr:hypothetical protein V496_08669 [Pseudogymnoascus sp. VKM F-4515 (FW-2607)]